MVFGELFMVFHPNKKYFNKLMISTAHAPHFFLQNHQKTQIGANNIVAPLNLQQHGFSLFNYLLHFQEIAV